MHFFDVLLGVRRPVPEIAAAKTFPVHFASESQNPLFSSLSHPSGKVPSPHHSRVSVSCI